MGTIECHRGIACNETSLRSLAVEHGGLDRQNAKANEELKANQTNNFADKLPAVGWSLFFIWVGIALLMKVRGGVGLLGVGIITLGMQVARMYLNLKLEVFWVIIGALFVAGGLWGLFAPKLPLVPILLIVAGSALFVSAVMRKA